MSRSNPSPQTQPTNPSVPARLSPIAGFTLIEILVAFVITALAVGALYRMTSTGLAAGSTADRYSRALLIAEAAMEVEGIAEPLASQTSTRRIDGIYDQNITIRARPDLLRRPATRDTRYPYEVSVVITWHDGRRARTLTLSTLRLGAPP
jgi:general secretion pathway protein I